jgi:ADP-ribose pyrophosphatase
MEEIKRIDRVPIHQGSKLTMYEDSILMPDGSVAKWDFLGHIGAAAVVAVTDDGKLLMVKQFRNAIDRVSLEIPAGCKDTPEESGLDAAWRELEEETGYTTKKEWMKPLIKLVTAIAFCNETIDIYVADRLIPSKQHLDPDEYLDVERYDLEELVRMIYAGEIQDSKTVAAIMAYKNYAGR